jgi:hypothetical protein
MEAGEIIKILDVKIGWFYPEIRENSFQGLSG